MTTITVRRVGNSLGVVLPKELIARLRVGKGDRLFVQETASGIQLTPYDPEFGRQMEVATRVMREDRVIKALEPATGSEVPAGKIGALVGFETGSWPSRTWRETVSRWMPSCLAIAPQDSPADRNE